MSQTPKEPAEIHLITRQGGAPASSGRQKRSADEGGSEHGLREFLGFGQVPAPAGNFKSQLERALNEINAILDVTSKAQFPKMEFESMEVGLAISAEGSIGIVTAGVEASLSLKFKKA